MDKYKTPKDIPIPQFADDDSEPYETVVNKNRTPKSVPIQRIVPEGARLYEKRGSFELYVNNETVFVNVTDYHPELLKLTRSDLEELLEKLDDK